MPSPLAHSSVALLCWPLVAPWQHRLSRRRRLLLAGLLVFAVNAPDIDFIIEFARGNDPREAHGSYTHSILAAAIFSVIFVSFAWRLSAAGLVRLWIAGLIAYGSHLLLDAANRGRGIALFWPWSDDRIGFSRRVFIGVRHSDLSDWNHHLLTLGNELLFSALVIAAALLLFRRAFFRRARA